MSQRLFVTKKVLAFLDDYKPLMEKRKSGEVKVLKLTLRVQPMDSKLAQSIDDGVGGDSNVRPTLFKMNDAEPKPHLRRVNFELGCTRQNLVIYASSDTVDSRMALLQAKIGGIYARTQKNVSGFAFIFNASVGPVSRQEQEFIHEWLLSQRAVTFEESEPLLDMEDDGEDDDSGDETEQDIKAQRPAPMWDEAGETAAEAVVDALESVAETDEEREAVEALKEPARHLPRRHKDKKQATKAKQKSGRRRK